MVEWREVEASGRVNRSGSYRSTTEEEPILEIRHDCVKSGSPTVVHQNKPYDVTPQAAEILILSESVTPTTARFTPPSPLTSTAQNITQHIDNSFDTTVSFGPLRFAKYTC